MFGPVKIMWVGLITEFMLVLQKFATIAVTKRASLASKEGTYALDLGHPWARDLASPFTFWKSQTFQEQGYTPCCCVNRSQHKVSALTYSFHWAKIHRAFYCCHIFLIFFPLHYGILVPGAKNAFLVGGIVFEESQHYSGWATWSNRCPCPWQGSWMRLS